MEKTPEQPLEPLDSNAPILKKVKWYVLWGRRIIKTKLGLLGGSLLTLLIILILLQLPFVQTYFAHIANRKLSEALGFEVTMKAVSISWFDEAKFIGLRIVDKNGAEMLEADVLKADFSLFELFKGSDVFIDQAVLSDATVRLIRHDSLLNMVQFIDIIDKLTARDPNDTIPREPTDIHIHNIILDNVSLVYDDRRYGPMEEGLLDYYHLNFRNIYANVDNFRVARDTIDAKIKSFQSVEDASGMTVKKFKTDFRYCSKGMFFGDLYASINQSIVQDSLVFRYESADDFGDFNKRVRLYANLDSSVLHTRDLSLFSESMRAYHDRYVLTGELKGTVENLLYKNMNASFGYRSQLLGSATFIGLPDIDNTLMNIHLRGATVYGDDLRPYLSDYADELNKFGRMRMDADFGGMIHNFKTTGKFFTDIGFIETDIVLKTSTESYVGKLKTKGLNIGSLLDLQGYVQEIDMSGTINGRGLSQETAAFDLKADISRLGLLDYDYANITTDGFFQKEKFVGKLHVKDPNLAFQIDGEVNLADSTFNFKAKLDTLNLLPTHLAEQKGMVKLRMEARFTGLDPSLISGHIGVFNTKVAYGKNSLEVDFFSLTSTLFPNSDRRKLIVNSSIFSLTSEGNYQYQQLIKDSQRIWQEIKLDFNANDSLTEAYYLSSAFREARLRSPYKIKANIKLNKDVNSAIRLFNELLYVSPNTKLTLDGEVGEKIDLNLWAKADTIIYGIYHANHDSLYLNIHKHFDSSQVALSGTLFSESQDWGGTLTENWTTKAYTFNDSTIRFEQHVRHTLSKDAIDIAGEVDFLPDSIFIDLSSTTFQFLDAQWASMGSSRIRMGRGSLRHIFFDNLTFASGLQRVAVHGAVSDQTADSLLIDIDDLNMAIFSPYVGKAVSGKANIRASLQHVFERMRLTMHGALDSIFIAGYEIGNIAVNSDWNAETERLGLHTSLTRQGFKVVKIDGHYAPNAPERKKLSLTAILEGTSMQILEPFIMDYVSNISGTAIGILRVKGSPAAPIVTGNVLIHQGAFKVNYLNTSYRFSDHITFKENEIGMKNLKLFDRHGHRAYISGGVFHDNFSNFAVQINGGMQEFMVLNTTAEHSNLYYGTVISTGTFSVFGPPENIELVVNARTDRGTKLYIPLDTYESVEESNFIRFVSAKDKKEKKEQTEESSGMKMDFNVELTPEAYCEIVFDKKSGDIIRGSGRGKIKMVIDLQGEFSMFGDVEIVEGGYNFTLLNVINKEFGISPNSFIHWNGDPYGAQLDIHATYTQKASLAPILGTQDSAMLNSPEIRRGYPVQVLLNLKGNLMSPEITFGIDVRDYPSNIVVNGASVSLETSVAAFKQRMKSDEQELSKQVFSLIVLKRLSPENTFSGISQSAGSNVSELLANQLSYWISQVDENLEIDVDLNGLNASSLNTFQLRLSYTFLNGRLRVSREGGFTNLQNEANVGSIIGDWTIEYLLTADGKLRLKMYHKQNVSTFGSALANNNTSNGVSLLRAKSFEKLKDLFISRKKRMEVQQGEPYQGTPAEDGEQ